LGNILAFFRVLISRRRVLMERLLFLIGLATKSVAFEVKILEGGKRTWTGLLGVINEVLVHNTFLHVLLEILFGFVP
jgi:hypothetical protein